MPESLYSIPEFDQLELLSLTGQPSLFPKHFHETFCISLIHSGIEVIEMQERRIYTEAGGFSINNPFEIHANPLLSSQMEVSFDTLYLSQEVVDYCCQKKGVRFAHVQPYKPQLVQHFLAIKAQIKRNNALLLSSSLTAFLCGLAQLPSQTVLTHQKTHPWQEIQGRMQAHLHERVSLEELARMVDMDKYAFAKQFSAEVGMSPMHYLMMQRVFAAKKAIHTHSHLTELAYEFGFADQAHFSRTFKRFIGISPRAYKKSLSPS